MIMEHPPSSTFPEVVIVADRYFSLCPQVISLLKELNISYCLCEGVFHAAAQLAGPARKDVVLVIGRLAELCRENMAFFDTFNIDRGVKCLCFMTGPAAPQNNLWLSCQFAAALRAGAVLIENIDDLASIIAEMLSNSSLPPNAPQIAKPDSIRCSLTDRELEALFNDD